MCNKYQVATTSLEWSLPYLLYNHTGFEEIHLHIFHHFDDGQVQWNWKIDDHVCCNCNTKNWWWCSSFLGRGNFYLRWRVSGNQHLFHNPPYHFLVLFQLIKFCLLWIGQTSWLINHMFQPVLWGIRLYQHIYHCAIITLVYHIWGICTIQEIHSLKPFCLIFDFITCCFIIYFLTNSGPQKYGIPLKVICFEYCHWSNSYMNHLIQWILASLLKKSWDPHDSWNVCCIWYLDRAQSTLNYSGSKCNKNKLTFDHSIYHLKWGIVDSTYIVTI